MVQNCFGRSSPEILLVVGVISFRHPGEYVPSGVATYHVE